MKNIEAIIFDMDGTLYSFDQKGESQFSSSDFGKQIQTNCIDFFQQTLSLPRDKAEAVYQDFKERYNGEVSLAVEQELGIDRSEYFARTWDLDVERFVAQNNLLTEAVKDLTIKSGILTAAPKVWAEKVLRFLQIREIFGEAFFTGDPNLRKPDPKAFLQLAEFWGTDPVQILSIGDQEQTDILPAKSLGMKTLRIATQTETEADFMAPDIITAIALLKEKGII